jgi:hypothetical protein
MATAHDWPELAVKKQLFQWLLPREAVRVTLATRLPWLRAIPEALWHRIYFRTQPSFQR